MLRAIPLKSITESNQLSYIMRIEHLNQGILITGDAGCVDFMSEKKKFHQKLINGLLPLHIIQIAHHAGNNAYFYRVLESAGYPRQSENSYLLLSHATEDKFRPSDEFRFFMEQLRKDPENTAILFTSRPALEKVREYAGLIYPPVSSIAEVGDIRLCYDGNDWKVMKHAIKV
jgi:hypothetical protein